MSVLWQCPSTPITVLQTEESDGSGSAAFPVLAPVPGSNRLSGQSFRLHASGSVNNPGAGVTGFSIFARYPAELAAEQYPVANITHVSGGGGDSTGYATLTVPGATFLSGQPIILAGMKQKDIAAITNVELTDNVVTITAYNDYVGGDTVTVAAVTHTDVNGTFVIPGMGGSTASFSYDLTHADITSAADTGTASVPNKLNTLPYPGTPNIVANPTNSGKANATIDVGCPGHYASHSEVGTVTVTDQPVFDTTDQSFSGTVPWSLDVTLQMDAASGVVQGSGLSLIANLYQTAVSIGNSVIGVNPALEPALFLGITIYFDVSDPANSATLSNLSLLDA